MFRRSKGSVFTEVILLSAGVFAVVGVWLLSFMLFSIWLLTTVKKSFGTIHLFGSGRSPRELNVRFGLPTT